MNKLFIIFHGRFPNEKAAGIFAAEDARSFGRYADVTMLVPRRFNSIKENAYSFYNLPKEITVVYLPTIDLFSIPLLSRIAFAVSYIAFSFSAVFYLRKYSKAAIVLTNEPLPAYFAAAIVQKVILEVHDSPQSFKGFYRHVYREVSLLVSTNTLKKDKMVREFGVPNEKILVEQNAVDLEVFASKDKVQSRMALGLPEAGTIVLYTGHLYDWKGVDTLARAAAVVPEALFYFVGGTQSDVAAFKKKYSDTKNIHVVGHVAHNMVPLWQGAADILVLPNSGKHEISVHDTSPMKLFEYMASLRPIVASDLPSIREILPPDAGVYVEPDNTEALAEGIRSLMENPESAVRYATKAHETVLSHSWIERAKRIWEKIELHG